MRPENLTAWQRNGHTCCQCVVSHDCMNVGFFHTCTRQKCHNGSKWLEAAVPPPKDTFPLQSAIDDWMPYACSKGFQHETNSSASSVLSVSYKSIWSESSNWSRLLSFLKSPWFSYSGQAKWLTTNWTVAIQMPILTHGKIVSLAKAWVKLCTSRAGRSEMISLQKAGVKPW